MKRRQKGVAAAMASLLFLSTTALTAIEAGAALKEVKQIAVQQGPLRGIVVNSEGKGLVKAVIDIRDSKGEVVSLGITKTDGSFCLASVPEGDYRLSVNGEFAYSIQVNKEAAGKSISLVVPSQSSYSAGQTEVAATAGISTEVLVAGAVVLTGTAVVLVANSDEDCE
jgi:hypothetical protein